MGGMRVSLKERRQFARCREEWLVQSEVKRNERRREEWRAQSRSSSIRTLQKIVDAIRDQKRTSAVEEQSETAVAASAAMSSQQPLTAANEQSASAVEE